MFWALQGDIVLDIDLNDLPLDSGGLHDDELFGSDGGDVEDDDHLGDKGHRGQETQVEGTVELLDDGDELEWEDVGGSGDVGVSGSSGSANALQSGDWRERMAARQRFWSTSHGFRLGRKLGDWDGGRGAAAAVVSVGGKGPLAAAELASALAVGKGQDVGASQAVGLNRRLAPTAHSTQSAATSLAAVGNAADSMAQPAVVGRSAVIGKTLLLPGAPRTDTAAGRGLVKVAVAPTLHSLPSPSSTVSSLERVDAASAGDRKCGRGGNALSSLSGLQQMPFPAHLATSVPSGGRELQVGKESGSGRGPEDSAIAVPCDENGAGPLGGEDNDDFDWEDVEEVTLDDMDEPIDLTEDSALPSAHKDEPQGSGVRDQSQQRASGMSLIQSLNKRSQVLLDSPRASIMCSDVKAVREVAVACEAALPVDFPDEQEEAGDGGFGFITSLLTRKSPQPSSAPTSSTQSRPAPAKQHLPRQATPPQSILSLPHPPLISPAVPCPSLPHNKSHPQTAPNSTSTKGQRQQQGTGGGSALSTSVHQLAASGQKLTPWLRPEDLPPLPEPSDEDIDDEEGYGQAGSGAGPHEEDVRHAASALGTGRTPVPNLVTIAAANASAAPAPASAPAAAAAGPAGDGRLGEESAPQDDDDMLVDLIDSELMAVDFEAQALRKEQVRGVKGPHQCIFSVSAIIA